MEALRLRHPAPYLAAGGETAAEFRHGVNFAVGGSTALPPEFYEGRGLKPFVPVSLANQTAWFDKVLQILGSSDHGKKTLEIKRIATCHLPAEMFDQCIIECFFIFL